MNLLLLLHFMHFLFMVQIGGLNAILYSEHDLSISVRVLPPSLAWRLMAS